ncbi:hypothetical protein PG984_011120 [Apiospora sp. TS-2023a]
MATGLEGIPLGNLTKGGYTRLATFMGEHPEVAVFKRFSYLNTLALLHMQAELSVLEKELQDQVKKDLSDPDRAVYDRDWRDLRSSASCDDNEGSQQWELSQKVTKLVRDYGEALVLQYELRRIGSPTAPELKSLRGWMEFGHMGNIWLSGPDREIWKDKSLSELVCLRPDEGRGAFVRFISRKPLQWYHYTLGHLFRKPNSNESQGDTVCYSPRGLTRLEAVVSTAIVSLLPTAAIAVLYVMTNMTQRLIMIGVFQLVFAVGAGLFTNGRMIEIFASTAAFAAIQVVFVGSAT